LAQGQLLYDGKTKLIFTAEKPEQVIIEFKDNESIFDGDKKARFKDKAVLKNALNAAIFEYLNGYNIPTHFNKKLDEKRVLVKKLDMIPLKIIVRNIAAGTLCDRFQIEEGLPLKYPVIEYYLKSKKLGNLFISESHAYAFNYATPEEMKHIARLASKVNAVLKSYLERRKIKLIDYQLEFGRYQKLVLLGDEITPDTSRLWDIEAENKINKKRFNFTNSKAQAAYQELYNRLLNK